MKSFVGEYYSTGSIRVSDARAFASDPELKEFTKFVLNCVLFTKESSSSLNNRDLQTKKAGSTSLPALVAALLYLLIFVGGVAGVSKLWGINPRLVTIQGKSAVYGPNYGIALVQNVDTSRIKIGDLVSTSSNNSKQPRDQIPKIVGTAVKVVGTGASSKALIKERGSSATIILSAYKGASIGDVKAMVPLPDILLQDLHLMSPDAITAFILTLVLGLILSPLLILLVLKKDRRQLPQAEYTVTWDNDRDRSDDLVLATDFIEVVPSNDQRANAISLLNSELENLSLKSSALRAIAEWSLVGSLEPDHLYAALNETADEIEILKCNSKGLLDNLGELMSPDFSCMDLPSSLGNREVVKRKTPFVPSEKRSHKFLIHSFTLISILISMAYLVWRSVFTLATLWISIPFLLLEIWSFISLLLYAYSTWNVDPPEVLLSQEGDLTCTVLIATYNEAVSILLPTVAAAVSMKFATETWVLDDGNRDEVKEMALRLGAKYVTRSEHLHAKAGNLNHALSDVTTDLVAVFDADHTPRPEFLSHTLGYFADPRVAVVQTPQEFYNLDSFEHFGSLHEESLFYRVIQAGKGQRGAAFWCGTNAVLRTAALNDVGGVSTDSIAEDFQTTIRFHRRGWKSIYHNEVLAHGLAAADISQFTVQRRRWGKGAMQVIRSNDNPLIASGLTFAQRISYFYSLSAWFDSWRTLLMAFVPIVVLVTGKFPFSMPPLLFVAAFLSTFVLQQLVLKLLGRGWNSLRYSLLFDVIRLSSNLMATLNLFDFRKHGRRRARFVVTDKGSLGSVRTKMLVPWPLIIMALLLGASLVWGTAVDVGYVRAALHPGLAATVSIGWAAVNLIVVLLAIRRVISSRFASERRSGFRLELTAPLVIKREESYLTTDISMTGCNVLLAPRPDAGEVELTISGVKVKAKPRSFDGNKGSFEFLPGQWEAMKKLSLMTFHPDNFAPHSDLLIEEN